MELKSLVRQFVYRIEPNPAGGFIARPADPTLPPLEAPTREELQQKIQAKAIAALGKAFPSLQIPLQDKRLNFELHVDHTPGGGFSVHSDQPGTATMDPATREKIDLFAEHLLNFVATHFPHVSETIATQVQSKTSQVFATANIPAKANSPFGISQGFPLSRPASANHTGDGGQQLHGETVEQTLLNNAALANLPITPESSGSGKIFRFVLTVLIIAALVYFFIYRR